MTLLLLTIVSLIGLLIVSSVFADHLTAFAQQNLPNHGDEGEQLILWGGMLLPAFVIALLATYLLLPS